MYHIFFTYFRYEDLLGCFQALAIINNATMKIVHQVSLWHDSFENMPKMVSLCQEVD